MVDRPQLMTVSDVAKRFGVSESTVRVWLTNHDKGVTGGVPAVLPDPLARGVVWLAEEIELVAPVIEARNPRGGRPKTSGPETSGPETGGPETGGPEPITSG